MSFVVLLSTLSYFLCLTSLSIATKTDFCIRFEMTCEMWNVYESPLLFREFDVPSAMLGCCFIIPCPRILLDRPFGMECNGSNDKNGDKLADMNFYGVWDGEKQNISDIKL